MKTVFVYLGFLALSLLVACQNSNSEESATPNLTELKAANLNWTTVKLEDLPNQPQVFVAANDGKAYLAMLDTAGNTHIVTVVMHGNSLTTETSASDINFLKAIVPQQVITTGFLELKNRLVKNHQQAAGMCRSSQFSEAIRNDRYEKRTGAVLLKLKGAWADLFSGFEVSIALDPMTGSFQGFTLTKPLLFSSVSFFSVPDYMVMAGPNGQVVRDYSLWISECKDAYARLKTNSYKVNEYDKMDRDASALVDLDARIGAFKNMNYEFNEISLDDLKN